MAQPASATAAAHATQLLKTEFMDKVAVVHLLSPGETLPWGTRVDEHRINPLLLQEFNVALDAAEDQGAEALVVIGEGRFFCNGMDLQYISSHLAESTDLQTKAELLMSRVLTLGIPTIAALNGHFAAAGAMLGLAFDVRVMPSDSEGFFFVPGIDIGLVYSVGMTELMKAKLPQPLWNEVLCFGKRCRCPELRQHGVVNAAPLSSDALLATALRFAQGLRSKGKDAKVRQTMHGIKRNLYRDAAANLGRDVQDMGFASGTWADAGRASKL